MKHPPKHLAKRILAWTGKALVAIVVFVTLAVVAALLAANTPPGRRLVAREVNHVLADQFMGTIAIERLHRLRIAGVEDARILVRDPEGRVVLIADGVSVRVGVLPLVHALMGGKDPLPILFSEAHVHDLETILIPGPDGQPTLAHAFDPKHPSPPTDAPSRGVRIDARRAQIDRLWAHGEVASFSRFDAVISHFVAALAYDPSMIAADVDPFELDVRGVVPESRALSGRVEAHLALPTVGERSVKASFDGGAGNIALLLNAAIHGDDLQATLHGGVGAGTIDARAKGSIGDTKSGDVTLVVAKLDPHDVVATAPQTTVSATAHVRARLGANNAVFADADAQTQAMVVAGADVPPITMTAHVEGNEGVAHVHAEARGIIADVDAAGHGLMGHKTADFEVHAVAPDLTSIGRLGGQTLHGAADVHVSGHLDVPTEQLDAELDGQLAGVSSGANSAKFVVVRGSAHGPFATPQVTATVHASQVQVGARPFERVEIDVSGSPKTPSVTALVQDHGTVVRAGGTLSLAKGMSADGIVVDMSREGVRATASVDNVRTAGGRVDLTGLNVTGIGSPVAGEAHISPSEVDVKLQGDEIDPDRLTALLGRDNVHLSGRTSVDIDVRANQQGAKGHVNAEFHSVAFRGIKQANVKVGLELDGRKVSGGLNVALDDVRADLALADAKIEGPPTDPASWKRITGGVDVDASLALATLKRLLPDESLPFAEMGGTLVVKAHLARSAPTAVPDATIQAVTQNLVLVNRTDPATTPAHADSPDDAENAVPPDPPWASRGVDVRLALALEGRSERVLFDATLVDAIGPVARATFETKAPLDELGDVAKARAAMERTPVALHFEMPERALSKLPAHLRPAALKGEVAMTLDVKGTAADPRLDFHAQAKALQPTQSKSALPVDGVVDATYDGRTATVKTHVTRQGALVADGQADLDAHVADFLGADAGDAPWTAKAHFALHELPIELVPQVASKHLAGLLSGTIALEGLHKDATLDTNLDIAKLKMGRKVFDKAHVRVLANHDTLQVEATIDDKSTSLATTLKAKMAWGKELAPSLDTKASVDATLLAKAFPAAAFMPFVQGTVHGLGGRIDADAKVHVQPDFKTGEMNGNVTLADGAFDMPAVGGQFHDVGAKISIRPWGTLRVDDMKASGVEGKLTASASAQLDGMSLRSAKMDVSIASGDRLPLTVQGVSLGEASGEIHANATMAPDGKSLSATVKIPKFLMELPQSSGHAVQNLDPASNIVIGMHEPEGRFVAVPMHKPEPPRSKDAMAIHVGVELGDDIWIKRDTSLAVRLTGKPTIDVGEGTQVKGSISLTSGRVEVLGKRFTIEKDSTISFTGDASDPQLVITALYEAPDKTKIYADIVGKVRALKVHLRSDPPQPEDSLLSLLLFGSSEGIGGAPPSSEQPDSTQRAAGLAGGVVTQGVNKALSGITSLDVATRLDTSEANNPKPEVEVRVSNDVVTRVTVQTGMPAPGDPPDRTMLSIDWAFVPRWMLESTVGDQGSTFLDILWRLRY